MTLILTLGNIASVEQPRCGLIINQASIPNDDVRSDRERRRLAFAHGSCEVHAAVLLCSWSRQLWPVYYLRAMSWYVSLKPNAQHLARA